MINMWASVFFIPLNLFEDNKQLKKSLTSYCVLWCFIMYFYVLNDNNSTRKNRSRTTLLKDHILHKMANISYK